jgi:protein-disulfide isomerase
MTLRWHVPLSLVLILASPVLGIAESGMTRWFSCGIGFWRPCVPAPEAEPPVPLTESATPAPESIAPEALRNWGTPVIGPSGALSYQLPPRPLLDLFHDPTDAHARSYLTWLSEKSRHREAAFAAIKRMAATAGYSVGTMPTGTVDSGVPAELLAGMMPRDTSPGLPTQSGAVTEPAVPLPQRLSQAAERTQVVTPSAPRLPSSSGSQPVLGPQTRVLYFFAPHCPYCAQETPLLNELLRGRSDVVGIAMDTTREALLAYLRTARLTFPVTLDQGESQAFGITGYPAVVVRDETGAARKLTGLATTEQLQQVLKGIAP